MQRKTDERPGRRIRSVEITFTIINTIQKGDQLTLTEIANELDHSKSTIYSHLQTLEDQEIIVRKDGSYRLGLQILNLANDVRNQIGNYPVIVDAVDELAEETGEIAQFGLEEHGRVAYLYKSEGSKAVKTASGIGKKQPIYSTSLGKAILAALPREKTEELCRTIDFEPKTANTITDLDNFHEELTQIADQGYAIDDEENIKGLRCIAVPVETDKSVLGAISVTGPSSRMDDDRLYSELTKSVQRSANVIEINTKFS